MRVAAKERRKRAMMAVPIGQVMRPRALEVVEVAGEVSGGVALSLVGVEVREEGLLGGVGGGRGSQKAVREKTSSRFG